MVVVSVSVVVVCELTGYRPSRRCLTRCCHPYQPSFPNQIFSDVNSTPKVSNVNVANLVAHVSATPTILSVALLSKAIHHDRRELHAGMVYPWYFRRVVGAGPPLARCPHVPPQAETVPPWLAPSRSNPRRFGSVDNVSYTTQQEQ